MIRKLLAISTILLACTSVAGQTVDVEERRDTLKESYVTVVREKMRNTTQTGLMRLDSKKLTAGYALFGSPDIIKTLQLMPGVAAGNELMSGLYVHGGDGNDNLFLLDGVPLYNISHFGGLFSSFNTDVIDNLDFYKSGFPARYGGRMSSVVDVETREGNMQEYHGSASIGLIDGRLQFEGPIWKDRTSFNVGLRRTWMDVITIPAVAYANHRYKGTRTVDGGYAMSDLNARITHRFKPGSTLNATFYTGLDNLQFGLDQSSMAIDMGVKWGSLTSAVTHTYEFSKQLKSKSTIYYSRSNSDTGYGFRLAMSTDSGKYTQNMDDSDVSYVREIGFNTNWDWYPNAYNHVRYGFSAANHWYCTGRDYTSETLLEGTQQNHSEGGESEKYSSVEPSVYVEDEIFVRYNLTLNLGLRYALFATKGKTWQSLEPRAALKWMLNKDISTKLSYTRMSQYAHLVAAMYMDLPSNCWMPSTASARPMVSDQVAGGIYTTPARNFKLNLEGWYKTMDHLLCYNGSNSFYPPITEWEKSFTEGQGRSYGAELEATYDNGTIAFSTYYTLSWVYRKFEAFYPDWYQDRNDNRHKLNLVLSWNFAKGWNIFANWNYHTGNRITFPTHIIKTDGAEGGVQAYDAPYNTKLPDYHRLDLGLDYTRITRKGRESKVNLSIYNAYNRKNPVFAFLDTDDAGNYRGMAYGLVPIIPTFTYTYKF